MQFRSLQVKLRRSKKAAFAKGTRKNLMRQWKSFLSFCLYFDLPWLPTDSTTLALYAQFLATSFKAKSSIISYISGVKTMHVLSDQPVDAFAATEIKLTVRGIARLNPHCPKQASPVTPDILKAIYQLLDLSKAEHVAFWALFVTAFFTFARKGNLVITDRDSKPLRRCDMELGNLGIMVTFHHTKTIQFGQRKLVVPLLAMPGSVLCPVNAYRSMVESIRADSEGPAFVLPAGNDVSPITYQQYQVFFRRCLERLGLPSMEFSTHSFRRGGASWAFRSGVPGELVKVHGDWLSDAYLRYLEFSVEQRLEVARRMTLGM